MNRKLLIVVLSVILIFAGIWYGLSSKNGAELQEVARIGYVPVAANLPLFVALENKYFEEYDLKVEVTEAQSPNHIVEGMLANRLDGAGVLAYPILFTADEKNPGMFKLFASGDETDQEYVSSIIVKKDSPLTKPEDIKGKKIGVYTGLVQVLFLKSIVAGMGMDPEKDVQIVEIEPRLQLQGLESGLYDALSTVEPFPTVAKEQGLARVLIENARVTYIQNPFPSVGVPLNSNYASNHPKAAKAYALAMRDAINFIRANPEKAKSYMVKYTPTSQAAAVKSNILRYSHLGEEDVVGIQKNADWMLEKGLIKQKIDARSLFSDANLLK